MGLKNWIANRFSKESLVQGLFVMEAPNGVVWRKRDYQNFAREAYMKNTIAFRCILERASASASVPWKQYDGEDPTLEQPKWLKRANPNESFNFLVMRLMAFYHLAGNSYLERVGPVTGENAGQIKELYVHRPDRVEILLDTKNQSQTAGAIIGYKYTLNGKHKIWDIDPITMQGDLLQFKTFHPDDDFYGLAPTEPAGREIDTHNESTRMNKNLLQNQGRPSLVASVILDPDKGFTELTDKQFTRMERMLNEKYSGEGVGKSLIVEGTRGTKVEPYGFNPQELDFLEGGREIARKICTAYRVPPQLIGIPGETKFSNYKEARASFWEDTVIGDLEYIQGELNNWVYAEDSNLFIKPELDNVPALSHKRDKLWERAENSKFLTINEKREMVGKDNYGPEGDVIYVSASEVPLGFEIDDEEEQEKAARKELESKGFSETEIEAIING